MISCMKIKENGTWKDTDKVFFKENGTWKEVEQVYRKVGGVWVPVCELAVRFQMKITSPTEPGFKNVSGGSVTVTDNNDGTWDVLSTDAIAGIQFDANKADVTVVDMVLSTDLTTGVAMFEDLINMTSFTTQIFDISKIKDFTKAWRNCSELTSFLQLDFTQGVTFKQTWEGCIKLNTFLPNSFLNAETFISTWEHCESLTSFAAIDIPKATTLEKAWKHCILMTSFGLITGTDKVTNFNFAWAGNLLLASFPLIDTSAGETFIGAWLSNKALTSFPLIDTSSATALGGTGWDGNWARPQGAWYGCSGLTSFPAINTSNVTDFNSAWKYCSGLTSFPVIDTSKGEIFGHTWAECASLETFPQLDFRAATDFRGMMIGGGNEYKRGAWRGCTKLKSFPRLDTPNATVLHGLFQDCVNLECIEYMDTTSDTTSLYMFRNTAKLIHPGVTEQVALEQTPGVIWDNPNTCPGSLAPFKSTWRMKAETLTIPTASNALDYDFTIDWGDSSPVETVIGDNPNPSHAYTIAGDYQVIITGTFPRININDNAMKDKLISIDQLGQVHWQSMHSAFQGCLNLETITLGTYNTDHVIDMTEAFKDCTSLQSMPSIHVPRCTSLSSAWMGCSSMTSFEIDAPALIADRLVKAWMGCSSMTSFNTNNTINTSKCTSINATWVNCSSLKVFPVMDFAKVTDVGGAWSGCSSLLIFPMMNFSSVTNASGTWRNCSSLTTFPTLDLSSCITMGSTWSGCLSIENFPTLVLSSVTTMSQNWTDCKAMKTIGKMDLSSVVGTPTVGTYTGMERAFAGCDSLEFFPDMNLLNCLNFVEMLGVDGTVGNHNSITCIKAINTTAVGAIKDSMFSGCTLMTAPNATEIVDIIDADGLNYINADTTCGVIPSQFDKVEIKANAPSTIHITNHDHDLAMGLNSGTAERLHWHVTVGSNPPILPKLIASSTGGLELELFYAVEVGDIVTVTYDGQGTTNSHTTGPLTAFTDPVTNGSHETLAKYVSAQTYAGTQYKNTVFVTFDGDMKSVNDRNGWLLKNIDTGKSYTVTGTVAQGPLVQLSLSDDLEAGHIELSYDGSGKTAQLDGLEIQPIMAVFITNGVV